MVDQSRIRNHESGTRAENQEPRNSKNQEPGIENQEPPRIKNPLRKNQEPKVENQEPAGTSDRPTAARPSAPTGGRAASPHPGRHSGGASTFRFLATFYIDSTQGCVESMGEGPKYTPRRDQDAPNGPQDLPLSQRSPRGPKEILRRPPKAAKGSQDPPAHQATHTHARTHTHTSTRTRTHTDTHENAQTHIDTHNPTQPAHPLPQPPSSRRAIDGG